MYLSSSTTQGGDPDTPMDKPFTITQYIQQKTLEGSVIGSPARRWRSHVAVAVAALDPNVT